MSRGLGTVQRLMLFRLADHEVRVAEACAERQRPYRPPDRWSLNTLTYSTFYEPFTAPHRERHERWQETLRRFRAGDEEARAAVVRVININNSRRLPTNLDPEEFKPRWPHDFELQRLNPGRAVAGLEQRGFVLCDHYRRRYNVALTVKGFAEARRLGGRASVRGG